MRHTEKRILKIVEDQPSMAKTSHCLKYAIIELSKEIDRLKAQIKKLKKEH